MKTLLIAAATALFGAAVITELTARLWPDSYLALLLLSLLVIFCCGLLNLRLARIGAAPAAGQRPASTRSDGSQRRDDRSAAARERPAGNGPRRGGPAPRGGDERRRASGRDRDRGNGNGKPAEQPPAPTGPRETGTVKWFNRSKGFGFIIRESGEEIFVHQRSIRSEAGDDGSRRPSLKDGQRVEFSVSEREKGKQADDVVAADGGGTENA